MKLHINLRGDVEKTRDRVCLGTTPWRDGTSLSSTRREEVSTKSCCIAGNKSLLLLPQFDAAVMD